MIGAVDGDAEPDADGNTMAPPVIVAYRRPGSREGFGLHEPDWRARGFALISRHAKLRECRDSREVCIVRVLVDRHETGSGLRVEFWHGARRLERESLDGRIYGYREDARRAKTELCKLPAGLPEPAQFTKGDVVGHPTREHPQVGCPNRFPSDEPRRRETSPQPTVSETRVCGALGTGVNLGLGPCQLEPDHADERHQDARGRGFVAYKAGTACGAEPGSKRRV
jgi:hypothetical protein